MKYNITIEQVEQLARIYNTFCTINTKGEDTITMASCLQAMKTTIEEIANSGIEETIEEKE